jgi:hypothetical protein
MHSMTDREKIDQCIEYLKKELANAACQNLRNAALHGSLAQDKTIQPITDADILFEVDDDFTLRMTQLLCIRKFVQATNPTVKNILGATKQARPVSPTVLSKREIRWAIVKTKHSGNFFETWTGLPIAGAKEAFHTWAEQRYRVEYFHQEPTKEIKRLKHAVETLQKLRADFCYDSFLHGNHVDSLKDLKQSYAFFFDTQSSIPGNQRAFLTTDAKIDGFREEAQNTLGSLCSSTDNFNQDLFQVLVVYEYLLPRFLDKLEKLVPDLDGLITEYNSKLKSNWDSQWKQTEH